jgi:hypothetical protein
MMETSKKRTRGKKAVLPARRILGAALSALLGVSAVIWATGAFRSDLSEPRPTRVSLDGPIHFTDARRQAAAFIAYDEAIVLTPENEKIMNAGLEAVPAPCCERYSIATCCCPCNLARSTWGLAKLLITEHGADADVVRTAATDWIQVTNPDGYTGDACFTGGCARSFEDNGCGGMDSTRVH